MTPQIHIASKAYARDSESYWQSFEQLHLFSKFFESHFPSPHFTQEPLLPGGGGMLQPCLILAWLHELVAVSPSQHCKAPSVLPPEVSPTLAQSPVLLDSGVEPPANEIRHINKRQ